MDDSNGGALPLGPFDERPTGLLEAALHDAERFRVPDWRERRARWLRCQLVDADVELWSYDAEVVEWLAGWEPEIVHAIGAWVARAGKAGA